MLLRRVVAVAGIAALLLEIHYGATLRRAPRSAESWRGRAAHPDGQILITRIAQCTKLCEAPNCKLAALLRVKEVLLH
jgi:hypothetical protein